VSLGRNSQIIGLVALAGLIIAGCQGAAPSAPAPSAVLPRTEVPTTPAPAAATDSVSTTVPTPRPVRTALEATDPTTVSLAVGRPTFVEFFAFW
jgi:hypothetical protein